MSVCHDLFNGAASKNMGCPTQLTPSCHKKAAIDVYIDEKTYTITLCCSKCDRPVSVIKVNRRKLTQSK